MPNIQTHQRMLEKYQLWYPREDENFHKSQPNRHSLRTPCTLCSEMEGSTASCDFAFPQFWLSGCTQVPYVEPYHTILFLRLNPAWNSPFKVPTEYEVPHYDSLSLLHAIIHNYFMILLFSITSKLPAICWPLPLPHYSDLSLVFVPKPLPWPSIFLFWKRCSLFLFYFYELFSLFPSGEFLSCMSEAFLHNNYLVNS